MILIASPGKTGAVQTSPAGRKPVTLRRSPLSAAWEKANPSMPELSAAGISHGAMWSSGVTLFSPWNTETFSVSSGVISSRIVRCAASILIIPSLLFWKLFSKYNKPRHKPHHRVIIQLRFWRTLPGY